ncbi:MAG: TolC family protein, partial [Rhodoferax sp.]
MTLGRLLLGWLLAALAGAAMGQVAPPALPGATLQSLLDWARQHSPELAAMQYEAQAAEQRVGAAGALSDPRFKMELQDLSRMGEQSPTVLPGRVGATVYSVTQELPWSGKRALQRDIASLDAQANAARAVQGWSELRARIKTAYVQRYLAHSTQQLVQENLDLMLQLEKVMQVRYAGALAAQQDITRIHVEHTGMRADLVALGAAERQALARLNAALARPWDAALAGPTDLPALPAPGQLGFAALAARLQQSNAQLLGEQARLRSAEKARDLGYAARYPDFTFGMIATQRQSDLKEWGLMLEVNLPLRDTVLGARERDAEAMLAAAQARQEATRNQLLADLSDQLIALEAARQTEHLMVFSLLPQAELTWQAALTGYENGKGDFSMLLDAQRQIHAAHLGQLRAQVDAQ